jgi:hypothetical protein
MKSGSQAAWIFGGEAIPAVRIAEPVSPSHKLGEIAAGVYELDPLHDPRWGALIENHPESSVFHSPPWLQALQKVYCYEPLVATTCSPGARLTNGLVFCRVDSWLTGRRFVSLPFSDHCEPLIAQSDELDKMLLHMEGYIDDDRWKYIEIRPVNRDPGERTELRRSVTYFLHRLDLRPTTQELFRNFHKDCVQRKIRRAEREKLHYEEGTSEDLLQQFYQLLVMTRRRQYLPPQPLNWFRGLIASFGNELKIRVASKDGVAVASILTLSHKKAMVYKYGCSDAAFNNLGGMALLFWKTIQEAKERGFDELEMGRSDADNLGLIAFKEHWGASGTPISYWTYPHIGVGLPSIWRKKLARRWIPTLPDLMLRAVGNLLYRHIA